jgi:hypothetical protein
MLDPTNTNPVDAARQSVIDSMVAAGATTEHAQVTHGESLRYDSATDTLSGTPVANRIPDNGRDVASETAQVHARINALQAQLAERVFDPKSGVETYRVSDPAQRAQLSAQFTRAVEGAQLDLLNLAKLEAQRDQDRISQEAASNERLAIQAFSNGDPARAQAMKDALLKAEADEAARAIVEGRRVAAKYGAR